MKTRATALALILLTGSAAHAQQVVPVAEEPMHRLMLDTETFQVLDPLVLPGDTTLFHLHDVPIHYVMISPSPANAQVLGQPWPEAGIVEPLSREIGDGWWTLEYGAHPVVHRVTNIGDRPFRLIAVTNRTKGEPGEALGTSPAPFRERSRPRARGFDVSGSRSLRTRRSSSPPERIPSWRSRSRPAP